MSAMVAGSIYYCFSRTPAYSNSRVESPNMAFDYVLYLACLVFASELAYIESRFRLLENNRDYYVLFSALLYFIFAYRFDNRLVLSLALSTLAAWCGLRQFTLISNESLRMAGIGYGTVVVGAGTWLSKQGIKKHFLETYLHVAANVLFISFLSGVFDGDGHWAYFGGLVMLVFIAIGGGVHFRRFAFVVYGTVYGYIGISFRILRDAHEFTAVLGYLVGSGAIVIVSIVLLARRFGREE